MTDVATCPLCYHPPTLLNVDGGATAVAACNDPACPLHGYAIPLAAWNLLAERVEDLELQIDDLADSDRRRRGSD